MINANDTKPGDKIRVIDNKNADGDIRIGDVYTLRRIDTLTGMAFVEGRKHGLFLERFEKVVEPEPFRCGQRVRITDAKTGRAPQMFAKLGDLYTVVEGANSHGVVQVHGTFCNDSEPRQHSINQAWLEPWKPKIGDWVRIVPSPVVPLANEKFLQHLGAVARVEDIDSDAVALEGVPCLWGLMHVEPTEEPTVKVSTIGRAPDVLVVDPPAVTRSYDFNAGDLRYFGSQEEAVHLAELRVKDRGCRQQVRLDSPVTLELPERRPWLIQDI